MSGSGFQSMEKSKLRYIAKKGNITREANRKKRICAVNNCGRIHFCKSYCIMHYRAVSNGYKIRESPTPRSHMNVLERLCEFMDVGDGCWEWKGNISHSGYGRMRYKGKHKIAHRLSYETFIGTIPLGLALDHLCENKSCVNPFHLEPVTLGENIRRHHNNRRIYER